MVRQRRSIKEVVEFATDEIAHIVWDTFFTGVIVWFFIGYCCKYIDVTYETMCGIVMMFGILYNLYITIRLTILTDRLLRY
jgi:hypothetical protein